MTRLVRFMDDDRAGRWARIQLASGEPVWLSLAQTGVLVKRSRMGLMGRKLYEEQDLDVLARTVAALDNRYVERLTPPTMTNPALVAFSNAILHCESSGEVQTVLQQAGEFAEIEDAYEQLDAVAPSMEELSSAERLDTIIATADLRAQLWRELTVSRPETLGCSVPPVEDPESFTAFVKGVALGVALLEASPDLRGPLEARLHKTFSPDICDLLLAYERGLAELSEAHGSTGIAAGYLILTLLVGEEQEEMERYVAYASEVGASIVTDMTNALQEWSGR